VLPVCQGWVSEFNTDRGRIVEPLAQYCFQQWGRQRLFVSFCGHAVHQDCWDSYYASLIQQVGQHRSGRGRAATTHPVVGGQSSVEVEMRFPMGIGSTTGLP
jgi:hypothetical protein